MFSGENDKELITNFTD